MAHQAGAPYELVSHWAPTDIFADGTYPGYVHQLGAHLAGNPNQCDQCDRAQLPHQHSRAYVVHLLGGSIVSMVGSLHFVFTWLGLLSWL